MALSVVFIFQSFNQSFIFIPNAHIAPISILPPIVALQTKDIDIPRVVCFVGMRPPAQYMADVAGIDEGQRFSALLADMGFVVNAPLVEF